MVDEITLWDMIDQELADTLEAENLRIKGHNRDEEISQLDSTGLCNSCGQDAAVPDGALCRSCLEEMET